MKTIYSLLILFVISCSKEKISYPSKAILLFPTNNNICLDSTQDSSFFSNINFVWQSSENTDSYELVIQNQISLEVVKYVTKFSNLQVNLKKGVPYSWWINSNSEAYNISEKSESWNFYLEGSLQSSYIPFPAKIISPNNQSVVNLSSGKIILSWEGIDLDNDIVDYSIWIGQKILDLTIVKEKLKNSITEINLEPEKTYYWKVETFDNEGNSSFSEIYSFTTK